MYNWYCMPGNEPTVGGPVHGRPDKILSFSCNGNEQKLTECSVSLLGSFNLSHNSRVVCGRYADHCDLSSTQEACSTTVPLLNASSNRMEDPPCPTDTSTAAYATIIGILFVLLMAVIIGWIITCVLIIPRRKGVSEYNVTE